MVISMKKKDFVIIGLMIALDQLTKFYISHTLDLYQPVEVIKNFFYITYARNTGAAWSMGEGLGGIFAIVAIAVSIGIVYYINKNKVNAIEKIVGMFIIIGAIGNAIDRVFIGSVIDFLDFYIFGYDFPIFNVADIFITVAAGLLILDLFFTKEEK